MRVTDLCAVVTAGATLISFAVSTAAGCRQEVCGYWSGRDPCT